MLVHLIVVPDVSETILNPFHSFFFILLCSSYFYYFIFQVTYSFFCLSYSAIDSFQKILNFIYCVVHHCLFALQFFQVLVKCFLYFLRSISKILDHLYYHYSEFFFRQAVCFLFIFSSGGFLPCSFIYCVFLCLLILLNLLCLGSPFCRLHVLSSHCFWCVPPVAKVGSVGCVGFLVEGTGACVLMDETRSYLSGGQDCIWWCFGVSVNLV